MHFCLNNCFNVNTCFFRWSTSLFLLVYFSLSLSLYLWTCFSPSFSRGPRPYQFTSITCAGGGGVTFLLTCQHQHPSSHSTLSSAVQYVHQLNDPSFIISSKCTQIQFELENEIKVFSFSLSVTFFSLCLSLFNSVYMWHNVNNNFCWNNFIHYAVGENICEIITKQFEGSDKWGMIRSLVLHRLYIYWIRRLIYCIFNVTFALANHSQLDCCVFERRV